jgi:exonuclease VII small subunit
MNKKDKKQIELAIGKLEEARLLLETIKEGEESKKDNLPENLQSSQTAEKFDEAISVLEEVVDSLDEHHNSLMDLL